MGRISVVVRQRITHPRHAERFHAFMRDQERRLRGEIAELADVRRYRFEKDELFFYTFYDFRPERAWDDRLRGHARAIRAAWRELGPDMREYTCVPYEEIWKREAAGQRSAPAERPLVIERLSFDPSAPDQERAWNEWNEREMLPDRLSRLPLAAEARYRAVVGDPRYYLQIQEYLDEAQMRESIARSEKPGAAYGASSPSPFWAGWARFMPYVDDLTRWILLPVKAAAPSDAASAPAKA